MKNLKFLGIQSKYGTFKQVSYQSSLKKPSSAITQLLRNRADAVLDANSSENLNRSSSDSNTFTQFSIFQGKPAFFGSQASDETIEQKPKYGDYDLYVPYKSVISYR